MSPTSVGSPVSGLLAKGTKGLPGNSRLDILVSSNRSPIFGFVVCKSKHPPQSPRVVPAATELHGDIVTLNIVHVVPPPLG